MKQFTTLFWQLDATTDEHERIAALRDYFTTAAAEDAVCAIRLLSGGEHFPVVSTESLRQWAALAAGIPLWLVEECDAHVGDLAETLALLLPPPCPGSGPEDVGMGLVECMTTIDSLRSANEPQQRATVERIWRLLTTQERIVWHALLIGGCRVGVLQSLVAQALAEVAGVEPAMMAHRLAVDGVADAQSYQRLLGCEPTATDGEHG